MSASLDTTKVSPIASGGRTESDIFPLESKAATHPATFFSACKMNCGAVAFGPSSSSSFTVSS
jgi:hypothetical protein